MKETKSPEIILKENLSLMFSSRGQSLEEQEIWLRSSLASVIRWAAEEAKPDISERELHDDWDKVVYAAEIETVHEYADGLLSIADQIEKT